MTNLCKFCGEVFTKKMPHQVFCSPECNTKYWNIYARDKLNNSYICRWRIFVRDNFTCVYCNKSALDDNVKIELDHLIPQSKGGKDLYNNVVTSCRKCNLSKRNRMPSDSLIKKIRNKIEKNERNNTLIKKCGNS